MDASTPRRALCDAASAGNLGAIRRVLDGGGDPNALLPAQTPDRKVYETTALVLAAGKGHFEVAALLLDRGASPEKPNSIGWTPLLAAACHGQAAVVGLLAERGADLTATSSAGLTAFHFACFFNRPSCVEALVRADCDTAAKTNDGQTGKDLAEERGHTAVLESLRNLMAARLGEATRPFLRALSANCLHTAVHWKNGIVALESVSNLCLE